MAKSTKPKEEVTEPIVETIVEETVPEVEPTVEPIYIPEIPAQVEEGETVVEETFVPLHKRNKCRA